MYVGVFLIEGREGSVFKVFFEEWYVIVVDELFFEW